jgi:hypothetical protein
MVALHFRVHIVGLSTVNEYSKRILGGAAEALRALREPPFL